VKILIAANITLSPSLSFSLLRKISSYDSLGI